MAGLALVLAGCTSTEKENEGPYPREAKENFVDDCATAAKRQSPQAVDRDLRERCQCLVDELENRIPYAREGANNDFKEIDRGVRAQRELTGAPRDDFDEATATCAD